MKKAILLFTAFLFSTFVFAQENALAPKKELHIHREKKELKREKYSDRPDRQEIRIHRSKRDLQQRNGRRHDWNRDNGPRPHRRGSVPNRRPMMDRNR